jgi:inner membrane protein involved in colicin E2 resistance
MKLTVLTWLKDELVVYIGKLVELLFRLLLLILPMGLFLLLIQGRSKASSIRTILDFTEDNSRWQHIFPGFILVAIDPNVAKATCTKIRVNIQSWINSNKYLLGLMFMTLIVALMIIKG